jgi:predicted DNA-binding protein (MmcQ/YjbR family)
MPAADPLHDRLLALATRLPGAYEDRPWGSVHCKVAGKIFVGWGRTSAGEMSVGFKTDKDLQALLVSSDPRFTVAEYVGRHGWVNMRLAASPDWDEVESFIVDSYRRIAPKKLVKALAAAPPVAATAKKAPVAKKKAPVTKKKAATAKKKARG